MSLGTTQKSTYEGNNLWSWSVRLTGTDAELDQVDYVVYHLHPTFREPVRKVTDRATSFEMSTAGWGSFQILIEVFLKDNSIMELTHDLELYYPEGQEQVKSRSARPRGTSADEKSQRTGEEEHPGAGQEKSLRSPRVFLSRSASEDVDLDELRKNLENEGIEVVGEEDLDPGRPWSLQLEELKDESDAVIGVVSGQRMSRVVSNDLSDAVRVGKPVMIISTGDEKSSPASEFLQPEILKSSQVLYGKDSKKIASLINTKIRGF